MVTVFFSHRARRGRHGLCGGWLVARGTCNVIIVIDERRVLLPFVSSQTLFWGPADLWAGSFDMSQVRFEVISIFAVAVILPGSFVQIPDFWFVIVIEAYRGSIRLALEQPISPTRRAVLLVTLLL